MGVSVSKITRRVLAVWVCFKESMQRQTAVAVTDTSNITNKYERRSITKLQNGAIPLILKTGKIQNIRFVRNLILKIHRNFLMMTSFVINNAFSTTSKLCTPNMYCWSQKTLVTIHWTHLRVNLICIKSYCPQKKRITACCSIRDDFNDVAIFNVYK